VMSMSVLMLITILAMGALSKAWTAEPGPATGLAVAGSALLLVASGALALRILVVVARHAADASRQADGTRGARGTSNADG